MPILNWKGKKPFKISKTIKKAGRNTFYNYILPVGEKEVSAEDLELIKDECFEQAKKGRLEIIPDSIPEKEEEKKEKKLKQKKRKRR